MWRREQEYRPFPRAGGRDDTHGDVEVPLMLALLGLPRGGDVLEIGCGAGATLRALEADLRPARLVGLDIDETSLARARVGTRSRSRFEFVRGDVRAMPFSDGSFDIVVDLGTCFHIARAATALAEISRVLRVGGRLVTETRFNQLLSHPIRSWGRSLPWRGAPALRIGTSTLMWDVRRRA